MRQRKTPCEPEENTTWYYQEVKKHLVRQRERASSDERRERASRRLGSFEKRGCYLMKGIFSALEKKYSDYITFRSFLLHESFKR